MRKTITLLLLLLPFSVFAETTFEIGQGWASGSPGNAAVILGERSKKYGVAIGIIERHVVPADGVRWRIPRNMFVDVQRFWQTPGGKWELGIGPAYFQNTSRVFARNLNWSILLRYNLDVHASIVIRHWSNAGTGEYNMGHDFIGLGFSFGN